MSDNSESTTAVDSPPARSPADNAQLALLLEVTGTPKPGNVDRHRDLDDLRFGQFMAGAVGAGEGLRRAADDDAVGPAFERAVAGMADRADENTQFGCLLLLVPLVRAAARDTLTPDGVTEVVESTTIDDAVAFYRAFDTSMSPSATHQRTPPHSMCAVGPRLSRRSESGSSRCTISWNAQPTLPPTGSPTATPASG
jgi:Triphosphoribosyl-dephospho-CoA synthetase